MEMQSGKVVPCLQLPWEGRSRALLKNVLLWNGMEVRFSFGYSRLASRDGQPDFQVLPVLLPRGLVIVYLENRCGDGLSLLGYVKE